MGFSEKFESKKVENSSGVEGGVRERKGASEDVVEGLAKDYKGIPPSLIDGAMEEVRYLSGHTGYVALKDDIYVLTIKHGDLIIGPINCATGGIAERAVDVAKIRKVMLTAASGKIEGSPSHKVESISSILSELQSKYKIEISFEKIHSDGLLGKRPNVSESLVGLQDLQEALDKYPSELISAHKFKVYLLADLHEIRGGKKERIGGAVDLDKVIYIDVNRRGQVFHHEFFHFLDMTDEFKEDDEDWVKLNPNGKDAYEHMSGTEAIFSGDLDEGGKCVDRRNGFARNYGYCGGPNEDQAVEAEGLFNVRSELWLPLFWQRVVKENVLRNKVEMLTGCEFDPKKKEFVRTISENEYKDRFDTDGYEYYPKWSKASDGKILMNHEYWNKIMWGKK